MKSTRRRLSSFGKAFLLVAFALASTACEVTFINPLPDSLKVPRDNRLLGRWMTRDTDTGKPGYIRFTNAPNDEMIVSFESGDPGMGFRLTTLKIDGAGYLSLRAEEPNRNRGYLLAKYAIEGDRLKVWLMDDKRMRRVVESKRLKGEFGPESYSGVTITDTAQNVLNFIKTDGQELFKLLAEFERVEDK